VGRQPLHAKEIDVSKAAIAGLLLGLVLGIETVGILSLVSIYLLAYVIESFELLAIVLGSGFYISKYCVVESGVSFQTGGEIYGNYGGSITLDPGSGHEISMNEYGGGIGTQGFQFLPISQAYYITLYPEYSDLEEVEDSYIELGGSIPVLGGTVGVDFLVSPENGIKGFTLSFGLKADIPEVHIGGGN